MSYCIATNRTALKATTNQKNYGSIPKTTIKDNITNVFQISLSNPQNTKGNPLISPCFNGNIQEVEKLISRNKYINEPDDKGMTPLMWASLAGHYDIVELLLRNGAKANAQDNRQETALMYASENGHDKVVQLLIDNDPSNINA